MSPKFTNRLQRVLVQAAKYAFFEKSREVQPGHVLSSLVLEKGSVARELLIRCGFKINDDFKTEKREVDIRKILHDSKKINLSQSVKSAIERSVSWAAKLENKYVGTEHMLFGLLKEKDEKILKILLAYKVDVEKLIQNLEIIFISQKQFPENFNITQNGLEEIFESIKQAEDGYEESETFEKNKAEKQVKVKEADESALKKQKKPRQRQSALEFFGRNLTSEKIQEIIDPVIGRNREIERIIQILCRRRKNNPVLLGDAGVGKTAIVEGLAKKILDGDVSDALLDKKIYALDLNLMIAGTIMRGEFELRLKQVLDEVKQRPEVVLFIDEIHTIVGAGSASGSMDAANILKPALARGEIRCIGATTYEDYKKYIEDDSALERRFQPVEVPEPTIKETIEILKGLKHAYEKHHMVKISDKALEAAAYFSDRYITDRFLPDKAIDLIDEAAAKIKISKSNSPVLRKINFLESKLEDLMRNKLEFVSKEDYKSAMRFKEEEFKLIEQISLMEKESKEMLQENKWLGEIKAFNVAEIISQMKKIPIEELKSSQGKKIAKLENLLNKFIVGQNEAIREISFFIKRSRAGLSPLSKPLGSFIFLGPSGVGKTYTAQILAKEIFGSSNKLIRLDMSEFSESFNISRLIGSPPGYVGYKEGGRLTEAVRRNPHSVVLFDEIEKAHPQVFNLLLQIMEEGKLTDAAGKKVDFKNTIIILTSNLGLKTEQSGQLGFENNEQQKAVEKKIYENLKENIKESLKNHFSIEFLNRLDKVIVFKPLNFSAIEKIVKLELSKLQNNLRAKEIKLSFGTDALRYLAKKSYLKETGAREVKRVIQNEVENLLTEKILMGEVKRGGEVELGMKNERIIINNK